MRFLLLYWCLQLICIVDMTMTRWGWRRLITLRAINLRFHKLVEDVEQCIHEVMVECIQDIQWSSDRRRPWEYYSSCPRKLETCLWHLQYLGKAIAGPTTLLSNPNYPVRFLSMGDWESVKIKGEREFTPRSSTSSPVSIEFGVEQAVARTISIASQWTLPENFSEVGDLSIASNAVRITSCDLMVVTSGKSPSNKFCIGSMRSALGELGMWTMFRVNPKPLRKSLDWLREIRAWIQATTVWRYHISSLLLFSSGSWINSASNSELSASGAADSIH